MTRLAILAAALMGAVLPAGASSFASLGYSDSTTILGPETDACASGVLIHNHDGSFENGYAWQYGGLAPPYYGSLAEGYDLGAGSVACAVFWLTNGPDFTLDGPSDCYVWEGGVGTAPGSVLGLVAGIRFTNLPVWPAVGQNDVEMNVAVSGDFTVGYWLATPGSWATYWCAADENGPGGHPWTCIAPGIGYPSGWQDPATVWPSAKSMGCGVYFEQGTPAESETWGGIKTMFRQ